jgi:hypothetical protein
LVWKRLVILHGILHFLFHFVLHFVRISLHFYLLGFHLGSTTPSATTVFVHLILFFNQLAIHRLE